MRNLLILLFSLLAMASCIPSRQRCEELYASSGGLPLEVMVKDTLYRIEVQHDTVLQEHTVTQLVPGQPIVIRIKDPVRKRNAGTTTIGRDTSGRYHVSASINADTVYLTKLVKVECPPAIGATTEQKELAYKSGLMIGAGCGLLTTLLLFVLYAWLNHDPNHE